MFLTLATILLSIVGASLLGHLVHWLMHRRWTGPFYWSHMDHHLQQYPPRDLQSDTYRNAKWYHSGPFLFTPAFIIIVGGTGLLLYLLEVSVWRPVTIALSVLAFALFNDYIHDTFHIRNHWLGRFPLWCRLRDLHFKHHRHMRSNFGIVTVVWDKVFGTYRDG